MDEETKEVTDEQKPIESPVNAEAEAAKTAEAEEVEQKAKTEADIKAKAEEKPVVYNLKLPEGALLPPSLIDEISAYAKEKGLSNEAAQEFMDEQVDAFQSEQKEMAGRIREKWVEETKTDKEISGIEGKDFETNIKLASQVVAKYDPEGKIRKIMNASGIGDHPEVIKFCIRIGKDMSNDKFVHSKTQSRREKSLSEIFYGENKGG